jgi:quinol monooxygenase YgiN
MTTISTTNPVVTLINVFSVEPANQQQVLDLLVEMNTKIYKQQPGYVSANFHKSLDGVKVVNYSQWRSLEEFNRLQSLPELVAYFRQLVPLCQVEPHLYEVFLVDEVTLV